MHIQEILERKFMEIFKSMVDYNNVKKSLVSDLQFFKNILMIYLAIV